MIFDFVAQIQISSYTLYCQKYSLTCLDWGFPQGLGVCLWEFMTIPPEAHLCGHTLMLAIPEMFPQSWEEWNCSKTSTVLLASAKPRLVHQIAWWRSAIRHSRGHVSTALESSGSVLNTTASDALHCTCWCTAWMLLLGHGNPFHEALCALFLS